MSHHGPHYVHEAAKAVEKLPALAEKKDPSTAAILGFLFGPLGIGIYFKSKADFCWCLGLLIGLTIVIPGVGLLPGWLFSAAYGYHRANKSNEKLMTKSELVRD